MDTDCVRADGGSGDTRGCPKCGHVDTDVVSMETSDGIVSKVIDVPDEGFTVVSCEHCGFSELYRDTDADADDARDLFLG